MIDLLNIFNTWISKETSLNIVIVNQKMNNGNSEKYLKHKIALANNDKITEIINFLFKLNFFVINNPILLPKTITMLFFETKCTSMLPNKWDMNLLGTGCLGYKLFGYRRCLQIESRETSYWVQQHLSIITKIW